MGNKQKKKQARNVLSHKTFDKKKIKIGKTLKKTNVVNTEFTAKSLVILEQFNEHTSEPISQRGLTIRDLNRQVGHPSMPIRREAVIGLKQLLAEHPKLIDANLYDLVSSIGRLFSDEKFACDKMCMGHLKALIRVVFSASEKAMASSFELLSSHLKVGLTHSLVQVRKLTLEILCLVFDAFPALSRKDSDLYESFLSLMKNPKKPNNRKLLKEVVEKFREVYESQDNNQDAISLKLPPTEGWNVKTLDSLASRFYFPAFYGSKATTRQTTDTSWLEQFVNIE